MSEGRRFGFFFLICIPVNFWMMIACGAAWLRLTVGYPFADGIDAMASTITGGAIVHDIPDFHGYPWHFKLAVLVAAACGVGRFGFFTAVMRYIVVDPLAAVLGLQRDLRVSGEVTRWLCALVGILVLVQLVSALFFGAVYSVVARRDFGQSCMIFASVQLGGGLQDYIARPSHGLLYTVLGAYAIALTQCILVAAVADPISKALVNVFDCLHLQRASSLGTVLLRFLALVFVVLPVAMLTVMALVAVLLRLLTEWPLRDAFWSSLLLVSGSAANVQDRPLPELGDAGKLVLLVASSFGFLLFTSAIGAGSNLIEPLMIRLLGQRRSVKSALCIFLFVILVGIPSFVVLFAGFIAGAMAMLHDWDFVEAFWWSASVQLGGGVALAEMRMHGEFSRLLATVAAASSIGVSIFSVGLSGAPAIEPLIDAVFGTLRLPEAKVRRVCDWDQLEEYSDSDGLLSSDDFG